MSRTGESGNSLAVDKQATLGWLTGTIVGPEGEPVPGAHIWFDEHGGELPEADSDAQGRFRLGPLRPMYRPWCSIAIEADGFARQYIRGESATIFPDTDRDLGTIRVDPGRVFSGQIFDVDGQPSCGVDVHCSISRKVMGHTFARIEPEYGVTTDSEGRYRTRPVPVSQLCVWLIVPERQVACIIRPVEPGGEEVLAPIHLAKAAPIQGTVTDEQGKPVVGAAIRANEHTTTSDGEGRFTIHGFGSGSHFQFQLPREGYVFVNWGVNVREDGICWYRVGDDARKEHGPFQELSVSLTPEAWIEGLAIDHETGEPVRLERVVLCSFARNANGEAILSGCRSFRFEQPEVGQFRIPYTDPGEYHLTLSAEGYQDAETFTPDVAELQPIQGIVVRLRKQRHGMIPELRRQTISGTATRDGTPIQAGWAALWRVPRQVNTINAWILRGRTVAGEPICHAYVLIREGAYELDVPYPHDAWYVVIEQQGHALTQVGPINLDVNERRLLDIECVEGGSIRGRVTNVPSGWEGHLWVVAFTRTAIQAETRVSPAGEFLFERLPPSQYGLKVGHDAYSDAEVPRNGPDRSDEPWQCPSDAQWKEIAAQPANPWRRARLVTVESGRELGGVDLEIPE